MTDVDLAVLSVLRNFVARFRGRDATQMHVEEKRSYVMVVVLVKMFTAISISRAVYNRKRR
jgi:hypothetical protein